MSPPKSARPVSISYTTQPKAHTSLRLSTALPLACSGDMYAAVPRIIPCERGKDLGFALESRQPFRIVGNVGGQHFDRDVALQFRVAGAIDLSHAAGTKRGCDSGTRRSCFLG